jgi:hypothetical protein
MGYRSTLHSDTCLQLRRELPNIRSWQRLAETQHAKRGCYDSSLLKDTLGRWFLKEQEQTEREGEGLQPIDRVPSRGTSLCFLFLNRLTGDPALPAQIRPMRYTSNRGEFDRTFKLMIPIVTDHRPRNG